jgi:hypothetical protein
VKNGVDKAKYLEAFNSFGVQTKLKRAQQVATQYKLDSVPALVIDGHYTTSPAVAGHGLTSPQRRMSPCLQWSTAWWRSRCRNAPARSNQGRTGKR